MLRLETDGNPGTQPLSKGKAIEGGGKFVIGQLYQGKEDEFNEGNIYQVCYFYCQHSVNFSAFKPVWFMYIVFGY